MSNTGSSKSISFSTSSPMGNNSLIGYIFLAGGVYSLFITIVLFVIQMTRSKKFNLLHLEWKTKDHME